MGERDADVVVVGGGPVGMGLAIELGQRGVRTTVIERHPTPQPIPKGQNLTQRTMEHMHFWGVEPTLRAARTIPATAGIGGLTAYGSLLSGYHYDWLKRGLVDRFYGQRNERLPQYATEDVLRQRAAQLRCVDIRYGGKVTRVASEGDIVRLSIEGGTGGTVSAPYVVGCDGSRSVVREAAGITQTLSDHDRVMALLVFRSAELSRLVERFPGKSYFNVLHPAQKGYWLFLGRVDLEDRWFFHAPVTESARDGAYDFTRLLRETVGASFDVEMEHVGFWDLRFAIADEYGRGRMFVAGDAAHSHPPYGGYGINTGFEDARNLGWKLAAAVQGWGGSALLASYDAERRAVFASTAKDFIERSILDDRDFLERFDPERDPEGFASAWRARADGAVNEVDRFEPHYAGSPIVFGGDGKHSGAVGHHRFVATPGHHLAPGTLSDGRHVHDLLGQGFTLLSFGDHPRATDEVRDAAARRDVPLTVVEQPDGGLTEHYGAALVLVRPDGFVAWTGPGTRDDADAVVRRSIGAG